MYVVTAPVAQPLYEIPFWSYMKKFSKGQINYHKYQRKVMSHQCRRSSKRDITQQINVEEHPQIFDFMKGN